MTSRSRMTQLTTHGTLNFNTTKTSQNSKKKTIRATKFLTFNITFLKEIISTIQTANLRATIFIINRSTFITVEISTQKAKEQKEIKTMMMKLTIKNSLVIIKTKTLQAIQVQNITRIRVLSLQQKRSTYREARLSRKIQRDHLHHMDLDSMRVHQVQDYRERQEWALSWTSGHALQHAGRHIQESQEPTMDLNWEYQNKKNSLWNLEPFLLTKLEEII